MKMISSSYRVEKALGRYYSCLRRKCGEIGSQWALMIQYMEQMTQRREKKGRRKKKKEKSSKLKEMISSLLLWSLDRRDQGSLEEDEKQRKRKKHLYREKLQNGKKKQD